ncbi:MAG TPA: putative toxin-antitoxin system toxin component, PIN family [Chloroflexota bacterium]|nr:putative toxin-antitoxin system toxin component, PIN family [Chloroflexota bacterium]
MIRVPIDTTTLASGFVRPGPPPGRLIAAWEQRSFTLGTAEPLIAEVSRTLTKPYFARALSGEQVHRYVELLRHEAAVTPIKVRVAGIATHPEDDVVLAAALSGEAQYLVTSDHGPLRLGSYRELLIVSAVQFLAMLPGLIQADDAP